MSIRCDIKAINVPMRDKYRARAMRALRVLAALAVFASVTPGPICGQELIKNCGEGEAMFRDLSETFFGNTFDEYNAENAVDFHYSLIDEDNHDELSTIARDIRSSLGPKLYLNELRSDGQTSVKELEIKDDLTISVCCTNNVLGQSTSTSLSDPNYELLLMTYSYCLCKDQFFNVLGQNDLPFSTMFDAFGYFLAGSGDVGYGYTYTYSCSCDEGVCIRWMPEEFIEDESGNQPEALREASLAATGDDFAAACAVPEEALTGIGYAEDSTRGLTYGKMYSDAAADAAAWEVPASADDPYQTVPPGSGMVVRNGHVLFVSRGELRINAGSLDAAFQAAIQTYLTLQSGQAVSAININDLINFMASGGFYSFVCTTIKNVNGNTLPNWMSDLCGHHIDSTGLENCYDNNFVPFTVSSDLPAHCKISESGTSMPVDGVEFPLGIDTAKFKDAMTQFIKIYLVDPADEDDFTTVDTTGIDWIGDPARFDAFMRQVAAGSDEVELGGGGAYFKFAMIGDRANPLTVPDDKEWSNVCRARATQQECLEDSGYQTVNAPNCRWDGEIGVCSHRPASCPGSLGGDGDVACEPTNIPLILCNPYYQSSGSGSGSGSDSDSDSAALGAGAIAGIAAGAAVVAYFLVAYSRKMWPFKSSGAAVYAKIGSSGDAAGRAHLLHF